MPYKLTAQRSRPAVVAGSFYPGTAENLSRTVSGFLASARSSERPDLSAIIVPHAGYVYSGSVAARAFASIPVMESQFHRCVIVGPSHFVPFNGIAAPSHAAFATPLGEMPIDDNAVKALTTEARVVIDDAVHERDHAIEVELPFLQVIFGNLPIVPLLFGFTSARAVAATIAEVWTDKTLLVVSSDLSHYEDYEAARSHDTRTAEAIEAFDVAAIGPTDACGHLAIRGALIEAKRRGLAIERVDLRNSGDIAGDKQGVVGYGAWAIGQIGPPPQGHGE
jgi:AmmeMemoRadiSam system protein B